jgi:parvulin-like peptidyl-prolyl isomerase
MAWQRRCLSVGLLGISSWLLTGCARDLPEWALPANSYAEQISQPANASVTRSQAPEIPGVTLKPPLGTPPVPDPIYPKIAIPPGFGAPLAPERPAPIVTAPIVDPNAIQASFASRGKVRVRVRAWVNGRPIFEDEVIQAAGPDMRRVLSLPDNQRADKMTELINAVIEQIVDQELMYQDACKRIEKNSPKGSLDKMKQFVDGEFDKSVEKMRAAKVTEAQIREIEPTARRMLERSLISTEYARSRIKPSLDAIGMRDIREHYETHLNEFMTVDKVVWQDIFIPVGPNLPTVDAAKRFAEEMINKCRNGDDFNRLMVYNEGDSKLRGGTGLGQRRGEIRPPELEDALFKLREGEIGPVVPFSTGVHLIRVTKREYAGQMPLDDHVQKSVRKILEGQLADREYRRIVRELRTRAVVRMEREAS